MSDLFLGQTMTAARTLISGAAAYDLVLPWQADKVVVHNLTDWTSTAGGLPINTWFRNQTTAAHAFQQQVIDTNAGASFNFIDVATNGFTVADTEEGPVDYQSLIAGVSQADPCVVTTTAVHGLQTDQIIRVSDLGSDMPTARGMDQLEGGRYRITVIDSTSFSLEDVITGNAIDSTSYTAWVSGGRVMLSSRSISLNNPQVAPYADTPYSPTTFTYDPVTYTLTLGTSVMGGDGDVLQIEMFKYGEYINLGDVG